MKFAEKVVLAVALKDDLVNLIDPVRFNINGVHAVRVCGKKISRIFIAEYPGERGVCFDESTGRQGPVESFRRRQVQGAVELVGHIVDGDWRVAG